MGAKKMTHEQFLEKLWEKNEHYRRGDFRVVGQYTKMSTRLLIRDLYGYIKMLPQELLKGSEPSIRSAVNPTEYWIEKSKEVHGSRYDYTDVIYINAKHKVKLICREHGCYEQLPDRHLNKGHNCPRCGGMNGVKYTKTEWLQRFNQTHGIKYDYPEFNLNTDKISIVCKKHGIFKQSKPSHGMGAGCPKCGSGKGGGGYKSWKNYCEGNPGIFYILRCWNEEEEFYKVGITCQGAIKRRYRGEADMPYNYEIIKEIKSFDRKVIWDMEKDYMKKLKSFHYIPKIDFGGSKKECFSNLDKSNIFCIFVKID